MMPKVVVSIKPSTRRKYSEFCDEFCDVLPKLVRTALIDCGSKVDLAEILVQVQEIDEKLTWNAEPIGISVHSGYPDTCSADATKKDYRVLVEKALRILIKQWLLDPRLEFTGSIEVEVSPISTTGCIIVRRADGDVTEDNHWGGAV